MKRTITIIIILISIIILSILSLFSIYNNKNYMFNALDKIEVSVSNNDFDTALKQVENLETYWESKSKIYTSFIGHDNINKTSEHLKLLIKSIKLNNNFHSTLEIENVKFYVNEILQTELPILGNIL